jgi:hypothetical protein
MSNNSSNISVPIKGMNTDVHPANLSEQGYDFALNTVIEDFSGDGFPLLQNEASNLLGATFPTGYQVIGILNIVEQDRKILFLTNPTSGFGQMGELITNPKCDERLTDSAANTGQCESCGGEYVPEASPLEIQSLLPCAQYFPIATQTCFNFSINNPINSVYRLEDCGVSVYFTDDRNPYRYIEFEYVNDDSSGRLKVKDKFKLITGHDVTNCNQPIYSSQIDCNKLLIDPSLDIPCLDFIDLIAGGNLKAGVYQFLCAYSDKDGNKRSPYYYATNPIPVFVRQETFDTDYITDRAIQLNVRGINVDVSPFEYYSIAVAKTINNVTSFEFVGTFPIAQKTFTYSGNEKSLIRLDPNDIFEQKVYYGKAKYVGTSNDYLFWAGLSETTKLNVQRIANKVKLNWQTIAIPEPVYRHPRFVNKFRSYLRDEVYAFGLVLIFDNGEESVVGHIPGPSKEYYQSQYAFDVDQLVNNDDVIPETDCQVPSQCCTEVVDIDSLPRNVGVSYDCICNTSSGGGGTKLTFNLDRAFTSPVTLKIGFIDYAPMVNKRFAAGYQIFDIPSGVEAYPFYGPDTSVPFEVTIPAGVTTYSEAPIYKPGPTSNNLWQCDLCGSQHLFYATDIYIKPVQSVGVEFSSNTTGVAMHSVAPDVPAPSPHTTIVCTPCTHHWQVYNTARIISTDNAVPITTDCDDSKCYQYGDFGYWQSTELYPNDPLIWGELCGKPVRHHKFPDSLVTHIHDGLNGSKQFNDANIVFPLGIRVDHQSVIAAINQAVTDELITQEDRNRIKGYRIVRGNRFGNKSIVAKGLLFDVWNYTKQGQTYFYPNYPYNDLRDDIFLTENAATYDDHDSPSSTLLPFRKTGRYTFHSPDTSFFQPILGSEIKLETEEYGKAEGYYNHADRQAKQKLLSTTSYLLALTGGLVSMLTATNEIRESDYTIRGVDLSAMGVSAGTYGPSLIPPVGPQAIFYENNTGIPLPAIIPMSSITRKTKQGTKEQMYSIGGPVTGSLLDPIFGGIIGVFALANAISYKIGIAMHETQILVNLIKTFVPEVNYGIQYNSVGKYNNFKTIANSGFKRRKLESYSYLKPEMTQIGEATTILAAGATNIFFNNWGRETSVYIKSDSTKTKFNNPLVVDNSRWNINCRGNSTCDFRNFDGKRFLTDVSSFYGSVKRNVPDQYGTIQNIEYIDTGHCLFFRDTATNSCDYTIFGGDTFISRFAFKRKHQYFLQTRFDMNDEVDVRYADLGNVAYPRYYFNTSAGIAQEMGEGQGITDIIDDPGTALGRPKSYLDSKTDKFFYQNGRMYLYNYGIPYFLVESDINVDYRYAENGKEKSFYPYVTDLDFWLQEKNVSPREDNYYFYNNTYSKQNKEHSYFQYPRKFIPERMCKVVHPNRVIYSFGYNWLVYKANDYYDFPLGNGRLVGVDGIENDKVVVRSENTTQVFNAYVTIATNTDNIQVGTGGMFRSKPQEYATTTLGYGGSQHNPILHTEFGHIWVDAKRGQIFNLQGASLEEISREGMKDWFKQNLPFHVLKDFPNMDVGDIDNSFKGIGIALAFDKLFNRFILTKLDYKRIDPSVVYDNTTKKFMKGLEVVSLTDNKYFCNRSWTLSYNFYTKAWTSYHSYTPNYYIDSVDYFSAGINGANSSLWLHNKTNKSYQVFFGKLHPFTVQTISKPNILKENLNSVEFALDAIRYHNEFDRFFANDITFNKAVVFTENQNSGLLELELSNKRNLAETISYPITNINSTTIRITNADGIWRFNQFYDIAQSRGNNTPLWLNNCGNSEKLLNNKALNYKMSDLDKRRMRGEYCRVKLTNDVHSNYKLIFKWLTNKSVKTYR